MTIPCSYCGADAREIFVAKDLNRRLAERGFPYHRCSRCRLIFLSPVPDDLGSFYPPDYYPVPTSAEELRAAARNEQFKLDLIAPFARSGMLLEVGPAFGNFAFLAKEAGFDVEVVEMDARCCAFLRDVAKVRTIHSDDAASALERKGPYDVVAMWHVIEHLPDFGRTLTAVAGKVRPGGLLVVAAPNPDALQFDLLGRWWTHLDAPRHVALIPPSLLVDHLRPLGFTPAASTMTDPGGIGWNTFGWEHSLKNLVRIRALERPVFRLSRLVTRLMRRLERNDRKGAAYTIVFKKAASA